MKRQGMDFWGARVQEQRKLGISAAEYCRRRSLQRGTFLRWRRRIDGKMDDQALVEIEARGQRGSAGHESALSIRLECGIMIRFQAMPDVDIVMQLVSAIRAASDL